MKFVCYYLYCTKLIICNDIFNIAIAIVTLYNNTVLSLFTYDVAKRIVDKYINTTWIIFVYNNLTWNLITIISIVSNSSIFIVKASCLLVINVIALNSPILINIEPILINNCYSTNNVHWYYIKLWTICCCIW